MIAEARARLLAWYDQVARDLPWRRTRDPYAIWVSEVMLQQTRVDTVIPYYERFLARFPTMAALASASEDEVLASWSGLGYYRRARFLHKGVAEALARHGEVPRDAEARRGLPGIGAYTAGAIGSIAFDLPEPIVDGNVARVLSRVHRIESALGEAATTKRLWSLATEWAEGERPGALNQALMELGATVCSPVDPKCATCPIASSCEASVRGEQAVLPRAQAKKPPRAVRWSAAIVRDASDAVALVRGEEALFGGLYSVPMVEGGRDTLLGRVRELVSVSGFDDEPVGTVRHVLSHRALSVDVYRATAARIAAPAIARRVDALDDLGVARLTTKILALVPGGAGGTPPTRPRRARARSRSSES